MTSPLFSALPRYFKSACLALVVVAVYTYLFTSLPSKLPQLPKPQDRLTSKAKTSSEVHAAIPSISLSTSHVSATVSGNPSTKRVKAFSFQSVSRAHIKAVAQPIIQATKVYPTKMVTRASQKATVQPHIKPTEAISPVEAVANATLGVRL